MPQLLRLASFAAALLSGAFNTSEQHAATKESPSNSVYPSVAAAVDSLDGHVRACIGDTSSDWTSAQQNCICAGLPQGVRCLATSRFAGFRGPLPIPDLHALIYSPGRKPSQFIFDGEGNRFFDGGTLNNTMLPLRDGWYQAGNCEGCD
jgi:hypothetical protein